MIALTIFDTPWHAISAFLIFVIGLLYASTQRTFAIPRGQSAVLYLWHTAFSAFYCFYSLSNTADSTGYFRRSYILGEDFGTGTVAIDYFTSVFTQVFGMSYFGVFMVYNLIGFVGLIIFAATLREISFNKPLWVKQVAFLIPFLPGLNFWTGAIGKDALTFLATALAVWSILRFDRRYIAILVAAALYLFARPHMAAILLTAVSMAMLFFWRANMGTKFLLALVLMPILGFALNTGIQMVGLGDASSIEDIAEAVEYRQSVNLSGGSSVDIASMSIPVRMFTYLFRPLGFDASGVLGLAASVENFVLLGLSIFGFYRFIVAKPTVSYFPVLFLALFIGAAWLLLGNTTANLGLALRQKWMFVPMIFVLIFAYLPAATTTVKRAPRSRERINLSGDIQPNSR